MRRVLTKFLEYYSNYGIRYMPNWVFANEKDILAISKLLQRKRFISPEQVNEAFSHQVYFDTCMRSSRISPVDKLLLLSGFRSFSNSAALKAVRCCATIFPTEYNIGCAILTLSEVTALIYLILKKYYPVKNQCDMKSYLKHLSSYIPWQSLTHTLKRFPSVERKQILNAVGVILSTYVETESSIKQEIAISIW